MNIDEKAMRLIDRWNGREYASTCQKEAALQSLIVQLAKEQDMKTRHACAEAVLWGSDTEHLHVDRAHHICMNVKTI